MIGCLSNGWIQITNRCNLKCKYCYADANSSNITMSLTQFEDIVHKFKLLGVKNIMLSGGEPCLHPDINKMVELLSDKVDRIGLVTNGTYIPESLLNLLHMHHVTVQVSIDAIGKENYVLSRGVDLLSKVTENIDSLLKRDIEISLSSTLNNYTLPEVCNVVEFALKNKIHTLHFCFLVPSDRCKQTGVFMKDIYSVMKYLYNIQLTNFLTIQIGFIENLVRNIAFGSQNKCYCNSMEGLNIEVFPNGDVYQCGAMFSITENKKKALNLLETNLEQLHSAVEKSWKKVCIDDLNDCITCNIRDICKGGCRAIPFQTVGNITSRQPLCAEFYRFITEMINDFKAGYLNSYIEYLKIIDQSPSNGEPNIRFF